MEVLHDGVHLCFTGPERAAAARRPGDGPGRRGRPAEPGAADLGARLARRRMLRLPRVLPVRISWFSKPILIPNF